MLSFRYRSYSRISKLQYLPHPDELILDLLEYEENNWPGQIMVYLIDLCNTDKKDKLRSESDLQDFSNIIPSSQIQFSTEWLHNLFLSDSNIENSHTLGGILKHNIETNSLKFGKLNKHEENGDIYR